jgi:hypothetical protein
VPNKHKLLLSTNPNASELKKQAEHVAEEIGGEIFEFLFDERKNLAYVTIYTEHDDQVSLAQIAGLLSEIDPAGIYGIGPLNVHIPEGQAPEEQAT